ncbi:MAG TPA: AAA family ATPase, partial [Acidimicrobiales bacterium]|nr:AAA family ATPase [Acidimicrobiales bacterium]
MVVTRAGLSPVMIGRVPELSRLRDLVGNLAEPRVALVRGEAGVGKTRLIKELTSELPRQAVVLSAQAEQGAMGRPYELLLEAVAPLVGAWVRVPPHLRRWEDPLGVLLSPVAPQLAAADRAYAADELARAGVELVRHLIGAGGGVVIFEDLHWADAESLGLFHRMAVTEDLPALLVGSYRPEDLDRRHVTDLIATIERQRDVVHLLLDRLSIEEVGALVSAVRGTSVSYAAAAGLHRRTGGNPFFLEELLVAAGDASGDHLARLPLPETLTEAVLRHLEVLDGEQRRVIDAAAILGQRIPFDLLAAVTGVGEAVLIAVLRELVGRGLVIEDDADVFSFRHALTREAIVGRLLSRERRRLHEKCLVALEEGGSDDWAGLAFHASGAGRWDEMVTFARKGAAHYLRSGATYQALRLTELALHEGDADLELLELATRSAWSVGLPAEALERAEQWRRLAEESAGAAELTRALRVLARLKWEAGDTPGHAAAVEAARIVAPSLPPGEERAWVANLLAESAMLGERPEEALEWADEALALGGPSSSAQLRAAVLVNRGSALSMLGGREDEGEQLLLEGLAAATEVEDYLSALRAINNLAHPAFPRWEPERSAALLDRMAALIERSGRQDWTGSRALLEATFLAHVLGDLPRARAALDQGT